MIKPADVMVEKMAERLQSATENGYYRRADCLARTRVDYENQARDLLEAALDGVNGASIYWLANAAAAEDVKAIYVLHDGAGSGSLITADGKDAWTHDHSVNLTFKDGQVSSFMVSKIDWSES